MKVSAAQRVAATVRAEMARQGIRQMDAAEALHMSQQAFSRRYRGYVEFRASELGSLSELLGLSISDLLAGKSAA